MNPRAEPDPTIWGENLRQLRKGRGLTLKALAEKSDLTASRLSQIETGKNENLGVIHLLRLQRALSLDSLETFFGKFPSTLKGESEGPLE